MIQIFRANFDEKIKLIFKVPLKGFYMVEYFIF